MTVYSCYMICLMRSGMLGMWYAREEAHWACGMMEMGDAGDVGCWEFGMLGIWDVGDVRYSWYGMYSMWNVRDVRCLGCGMFGMWNVWDVGCGMFTDVSCWLTKCPRPEMHTVFCTLANVTCRQYLDQNC